MKKDRDGYIYPLGLALFVWMAFCLLCKGYPELEKYDSFLGELTFGIWMLYVMGYELYLFKKNLKGETVTWFRRYTYVRLFIMEALAISILTWIILDSPFVS